MVLVTAACKAAELQVLSGAPTAAVMQPVVSEVRRSVLVALLVLRAGLGLATYWSHIVRRLLRPLARAAADLVSGRQAVHIDGHLPGELGALASQFNFMLQALQASQRRAMRLSQLNEAPSGAANAAARLHGPQPLYERICQICVDTVQASVAWLSIDGARVAMAANGSCRLCWWTMSATPALERFGSPAAPAGRWSWKTTCPSCLL